jgi:nickel/cobalt exporter
MAEIPTFQEMDAIDTDGDGNASETELDAWASGTAAELARGLTLSVGGNDVPLDDQSATASLLPGQGGLDTLRLEVTIAGPAAGTGSLSFSDANGQGLTGWREITVSGEEGVAIDESSVPSESVSNELRSYPTDLLSSPLDQTSATAAFEPGESASGGDNAGPSMSARPGVESGSLASVLAKKGLPLVLLGLVLALGVGAWHALLPGHGKTLMAAAMVGSGAKARQATGIAVAVALMHTASVLVLGLAVLALERTFRPEAVYPWLGVASGIAALAVGGYLLRARWSAWHHRRLHEQDDADHHDHGHVHAHVHGQPHGPNVAGNLLSARGLTALAFAGGILPAPSALLVMLGAIQAHRVVYGLSLVLAFSVGLAAALLCVGIGAMRARDAVARKLSESVAYLVPIASAIAIVAVGAFLTLRAASQV